MRVSGYFICPSSYIFFRTVYVVSVFVCVYVYCLPDRVVYPNHGVVVLQPWTGTTPGLGYSVYCYRDNYLC